MENKNQKVWIIVALSTILFLAIIFIGITYAYFTVNNPEGSTAQIISENGRMLINYNDGTDNIVPVKDIQPSNVILVNKTFTLTGINTTVGMSSGDGLTMPYKVGVQYTSGFSDGMLHYYIKSTNKSANVTEEYTGTTNQTIPGNSTYTGYSHGTFKKGNNKYTEMVTGEFPASLNNQIITFNLIIQFPDNNDNQDSEKGKTFNGKIVVNYDVEPTTFVDDTWETIVAAVQSGKSTIYTVGSEKEIEIDGQSYTVRVANNSTPNECNSENFSQTACGFVIEFVDIVENKIMKDTKSSLNVNNFKTSAISLENNFENDQNINLLATPEPTISGSNVGGWSESSLRTYANGDFFNKLPSELQNAIIDTKVISSHGSTSGETNLVSIDKVYLLSGHEVYEDGTTQKISLYDSTYNNTRQLDYYKSNRVMTSSSNLNGITVPISKTVIKQFAGEDSLWWLRSAYLGDEKQFIYVGTDRKWSKSGSDSNIGFAPAFRIG